MTALADALIAPGRAADIPEAADLYGFLVGSWTLEVRHYGGADVAALGLGGELHAARILEGRGVQDTWIMPARSRRAAPFDRTASPFGGADHRGQAPAVDRTAPPFGGADHRGQAPAVDRTAPPFGGADHRGQAPAVDPARNMYGTTLRIWDAAIEAWRITWINPARNHTEQQIGRARGKDIVQLGTRPNGTTTRWMFTEITARSFHWLGDALAPDGETWRREGEFVATRT